MKKFLTILAIGAISLVNSCKCKKHEDPKPAPVSTSTTYKSVQYRVEESTDPVENDSPISASVEEDGGGNAFIVIRYNPKYIKPVVGYPNFDVKPVIGYPAFAEAYALQPGVANNACLSQALVLISKSTTYFATPTGICDYLKDLKKLAQDCSTAKASLDPVINLLSATSGCK